MVYVKKLWIGLQVIFSIELCVAIGDAMSRHHKFFVEYPKI